MKNERLRELVGVEVINESTMEWYGNVKEQDDGKSV